MKHKGLNQLLCAATINRQFREVLLRNPAQALAVGYQGQTFALTSEERQVVMGIRAEHLEDLAAQIYYWISASDNGHAHTMPVPLQVEVEYASCLSDR
jgi:hypothetical protein